VVEESVTRMQARQMKIEDLCLIKKRQRHVKSGNAAMRPIQGDRFMDNAIRRQ
jgi:hypothetical protein